MQACRAAGASQVFVIEPIKARRRLAETLGASAVFNPEANDPGKLIAEYTHHLRTDIAFDCVGSQSAFDMAVKATGRRATICVVGLSLKPIEVPFIRLWGHEKTITFSSGYEDEFPTAICLLADRRVAVDAMVSDRIKLDELVAKGMQPLIEQTDKHIKILVYP